jgi:hypothetical protein
MGNANTVDQYGYDLDPPSTELTAVEGAAAGSMGTGGGGQYAYQVTFATAFGESTPNAGSAVGTTTTGSMYLTDIPLGPDSNVTSRKLYRTTEGGALPGLFLASIDDNITTTYTDTTDDGALGGGPPPTNTAMSYTRIRGMVTFSNPLLQSCDAYAAGGVDSDTAPRVPNVDVSHVAGASPVNGVTLPAVGSDTTRKGLVVTIHNMDPGQALNVWPDYTAGDVIVDIMFPDPYVVAPGATARFQIFPPMSWIAF